jgi:protein transport protein SEC61 subunit alpha
MLSKKFRDNILVNLLGNWQEIEMGGQSIPVGGLTYYISPPRRFKEIIGDPIHTLFYISFVLITCALFSKTWVDISGTSAKDVKKQLKDQNMYMKGHRDDFLEK